MAEFIARLKGREVSRTRMRGKRLTIGRSPDNDVILDNPAVSRAHAEVVFVDGEFRVRDLSENGVTINDEFRSRGQLDNGDIIGISKYELEFRDDGNHAALRAAARPSAEVPEEMPDTVEVDEEEAWRIAEEIKRAREQRKSDPKPAAPKRQPKPKRRPAPAHKAAPAAAPSGGEVPLDRKRMAVLFAAGLFLVLLGALLARL